MGFDKLKKKITAKPKRLKPEPKGAKQKRLSLTREDEGEDGEAAAAKTLTAPRRVERSDRNTGSRHLKGIDAGGCPEHLACATRANTSRGRQ